MNTAYPIYVISKGRWQSRKTVKALDAINTSYRVVVEPTELGHYASVIERSKLLVLPFHDLGQGSIPARNWVWEHSVKNGDERHWILDDNIARFFRLWRNRKVILGDLSGFLAIEEFVDRYENIAQAGMQYEGLVDARSKVPPLRINTRIYSCILLRNDIPHRWRGKYNEDTDLSLRLLKGGWCTVLFNAFLCDKRTTMTIKGGNDELYKDGVEFDGRMEMALSLQRQHPDVVKVSRRWGRWQHVVDYRSFKDNLLIPRSGVKVFEGIDNRGMAVEQRVGDTWERKSPGG